MEERKKLTVVLAGCYSHFMYFCRINHINSRSRDVLYVQQVHQLWGRCMCGDCVEIIHYETFMEHPHAGEILEALHDRVRMGHCG